MKYELDKIVVALLGEVRAYGDTDIDNERLDNLEDYFDLINYLLLKLSENIQYKNRHEKSIRKIYQRTVEMMKAIKEMVEVD